MAKIYRNHHIDIFHGTGRIRRSASHSDNRTLKEEILFGHNIIVATGSYPFHPKNIPFDNTRVHDSDSILTIKRFPKSLCVLGAGVIGCEYATTFATMGIKTFVVNDKDKILGFLDQEISKALVAQMQKDGITILFNNSVTGFDLPDLEEDDLRITLASGDILNVDMFLFAAGRWHDQGLRL